MLSTHHWCHVVDVATKISHSTELQVIRRVDNKYTQQHYFYLVACRVEQLWLFTFSFYLGGGGNVMVHTFLMHM